MTQKKPLSSLAYFIQTCLHIFIIHSSMNSYLKWTVGPGSHICPNPTQRSPYSSHPTPESKVPGQKHTTPCLPNKVSCLLSSARVIPPGPNPFLPLPPSLCPKHSFQILLLLSQTSSSAASKVLWFVLIR